MEMRDQSRELVERENEEKEHHCLYTGKPVDLLSIEPSPGQVNTGMAIQNLCKISGFQGRLTSIISRVCTCQNLIPHES